MNVSTRLLCLLPLFLGCAACNSAEEDLDTSTAGATYETYNYTGGGSTDRSSGGRVGNDDGSTEVLDLMVNMPDVQEGIVMVWIGDISCPPEAGTRPTFNTVEPVALPWRPGVPIDVDEAALEDGKFTIYTLVIVVASDGSLTFYESCTVVEAPTDDESLSFPMELHPVSEVPDFALIGQAAPAIPSRPADEPEVEMPQSIYLIIESGER